MGDIKVSGLPAVAAFATTQEFPVNDSGASKKITGTQVRAGIVPHVVTFGSGLSPASTTSLVGVMCGMGSTFTITPSHSGSLLILIHGAMSNNTASDHSEVQLSYGTGVAPANGAAIAGTQVGVLKRFSNNASTASVAAPFAIMEYVTGLTLATAYWIDLTQKAVTGGTTSLFNVDCTLVEF